MDKTELKSLVDAHLTIRQIAMEKATSFTNVRYWLKQYGLKTISGQLRSVRVSSASYQCRCGESRPEQFHRSKQRVCARCHNLYTMRRGQENKARAVAQLGGKCVVCGFFAWATALDFHHIDKTTKDVGFRHLRGWAWPRIELEIRKCVLLCRNCHAGVHAGQVMLAPKAVA